MQRLHSIIQQIISHRINERQGKSQNRHVSQYRDVINMHELGIYYMIVLGI